MSDKKKKPYMFSAQELEQYVRKTRVFANVEEEISREIKSLRDFESEHPNTGEKIRVREWETTVVTRHVKITGA